jgi:hypothetical protein
MVVLTKDSPQGGELKRAISLTADEEERAILPSREKHWDKAP